MARPITVKIDVTKILKEHLFEGKEYQGKRPKYLDLAIWPNKDGEGKYGDTHYVVQEVSKQARDAGARGPILGNAKVPQEEAPRQQPRPQQRQQPREAQKPEGEDYSPVSAEDDDIPF